MCFLATILLLPELFLIQSKILSFHPEQFLMCTPLDDLPVLHHQNHVGIPDGGKAMAIIRLVRPRINCPTPAGSGFHSGYQYCWLPHQ